MEEYHRLAGAPRSGRVVVQPDAVQIDKLTAHGD